MLRQPRSFASRRALATVLAVSTPSASRISASAGTPSASARARIASGSPSGASDDRPPDSTITGAAPRFQRPQAVTVRSRRAVEGRPSRQSLAEPDERRRQRRGVQPAGRERSKTHLQGVEGQQAGGVDARPGGDVLQDRGGGGAPVRAGERHPVEGSQRLQVRQAPREGDFE